MVQAIRSIAVSASSSQAVLSANSLEGNWPMPVSLAYLIRSSTQAWARCLASRRARLADHGVGGESLVAHPVVLVEQ